MSGAASLYRRHRPRTFDDVIGQEHVVRTLRNAVEQGQVHHAYLFVGSRGTGKTSMAKILASALNCTGGPKAEFDAGDPAVEAIANGTSLDVVELDAASNNGVDDIRELIDSVAMMPAGGSWKVYILDEAHMITTQGWNAFLKTLEEPPPNTVFVLATTEANKVLPTVADRCHRFDFRRPTVEQLSQALRRAADAEGIEIGDDAVALIARSATGSFRDALGTLEQLVTYGGKQVQADDVQAVLGVADFEMLVRTADAVADGDRRGVLMAVAEAADSGRDLIAFARDFAAHVRNLMVARTLEAAPPSAGLTVEQSTRLVEQAQKLGPERCAHALDLLSQAIQAARDGGDPRLQLELALFKAARPEDDASPDALLARIEALEQRAQPIDAIARTPVAPPEPEPTPAPTPPAPEPPAAQVETVLPEEPVETAPEIDDSPVALATAPSLEEVLVAWPAALATLMEESPRVGHALEAAKPLRVEDRRLIFAFAESAGFNRKTAENSGSRETIAKHLEVATGFAFAIGTEALPDSEFTVAVGADGEAGGGIDRDELVEQLKKEFNATEMAEVPPE
ncbi:MAG: DNA polymerase III subunit gamma/tau [Solirubrobacterales bacterium]